jgi:hypothetical protein
MSNTWYLRFLPYYVSLLKFSRNSTTVDAIKKADQFLSAVDLAQKRTVVLEQCNYHGFEDQDTRKGQLSPLQRFLVEGPSQQYALFVRPDNGLLSINKGCTCVESLLKQIQICAIPSKL